MADPAYEMYRSSECHFNISNRQGRTESFSLTCLDRKVGWDDRALDDVGDVCVGCCC